MEHYVPTDVDSVLRQVGKKKEVDNQDDEDELEYEPVGKGKKGDKEYDISKYNYLLIKCPIVIMI